MSLLSHLVHTHFRISYDNMSTCQGQPLNLRVAILCYSLNIVILISTTNAAQHPCAFAILNVYKRSSINHVVKFLGIFDPPSLSWSLLLNQAYVINWLFEYPLNCPRGLCMTTKKGLFFILNRSINVISLNSRSIYILYGFPH